MKQNVNEHNQAQPSTKRLYNSLGLWIFLYLTIISAGFYIIAVDSSIEPDKQLKPQSKNAIKSSSSPTDEPSKMIKRNSINRSVTMISSDEELESVDGY